MISFNYKFLISLFVFLFISIFVATSVSLYVNSKLKEEIIKELIEKNYKDASTFIRLFEKELIESSQRDIKRQYEHLQNISINNLNDDEIFKVLKLFLNSLQYIKAIVLELDSSLYIISKDLELKTTTDNIRMYQFLEYEESSSSMGESGKIRVYADFTPIYLSSSEYAKLTLSNARDRNIEIENMLEDNNQNTIVIVILTFIAFCVIFGLFLYLLLKELHNKTKSLKESQDMLILSSRFSAMGEMIGSIAHQWRQPLNIILSSITKIPVYKSLGKLDDNSLNSCVETASLQVKYLSQTIDDFRNFYKKDDDANFYICDGVESAISLVSPSLKNNFIKIYSDLNNRDSMVFGSKSRLMQVFINILNNAREILSQKDSGERVIVIDGYLDNGFYYVKFYDNGGGIDDSIKNKIFEPYFTTKSLMHGSGLGLYMSKQILTKQYRGDICVKNSKFQYGSSNYYGALFEIKLEINSN